MPLANHAHALTNGHMQAARRQACVLLHLCDVLKLFPLRLLGPGIARACTREPYAEVSRTRAGKPGTADQSPFGDAHAQDPSLLEPRSASQGPRLQGPHHQFSPGGFALLLPLWHCLRVLCARARKLRARGGGLRGGRCARPSRAAQAARAPQRCRSSDARAAQSRAAPPLNGAARAKLRGCAGFCGAGTSVRITIFGMHFALASVVRRAGGF